MKHFFHLILSYLVGICHTTSVSISSHGSISQYSASFQQPSAKSSNEFIITPTEGLITSYLTTSHDFMMNTTKMTSLKPESSYIAPRFSTLKSVTQTVSFNLVSSISTSHFIIPSSSRQTSSYYDASKTNVFLETISSSSNQQASILSHGISAYKTSSIQHNVESTRKSTSFLFRSSSTIYSNYISTPTVKTFSQTQTINSIESTISIVASKTIVIEPSKLSASSSVIKKASASQSASVQSSNIVRTSTSSISNHSSSSIIFPTTTQQPINGGDGGKKLSTWKIAVIAVCAIVFLLIIILIFYCKRRKKNVRRFRLYDDHIQIPGFTEYGGTVHLSDFTTDNYEEMDADSPHVGTLSVYEDQYPENNAHGFNILRFDV